MNWELIQRETEKRTSRASGAGGQHVNKTESRVELVFDVRQSQALSAREKKHLHHHLGHKIDRQGRISLVDQSDRSQHVNHKRALQRLKQLLERGIRPIPKAHRGKAFVANKKKRLERKKRKSDIKASRSKRWW